MSITSSSLDLDLTAKVKRGPRAFIVEEGPRRPLVELPTCRKQTG